MQDFAGRMIYLTGGSSGIGLEMGRIFVAQGADVLLLARNAHRLEEAARIMEKSRRDARQRIVYL